MQVIKNSKFSRWNVLKHDAYEVAESKTKHKFKLY